MVAHPYRK